MRLLLMRHGIAEERNEWRGPDALRPLSDGGAQKTSQAICGLKTIEPCIDTIASSPLLRARQTAEIAQSEYLKKIQIWSELEEAPFEAMHQRLAHLSKNSIALCVGHAPGLGLFASQLLTGSPQILNIEFKKAAVCAMEIEDGKATLLYQLAPRHLRGLRFQKK